MDQNPHVDDLKRMGPLFVLLDTHKKEIVLRWLALLLLLALYAAAHKR